MLYDTVDVHGPSCLFTGPSCSISSEPRALEHHHHSPHPPTMASNHSKENIADGLFANVSFKAPALSPKKASKSARKMRSKSIGPGNLGTLEEPALKESNGNRRKVRVYAT